MESKSSAGKKIAAFILVFAIFGVILGAMEIALRFWWPDLKYEYFVPIDPKTGIGYNGGYPFQYNHWKMREVEFPETKPPNQTRIICLGDSVTFGFKLPYELTWPKILERRLHQAEPQKEYFVINTAGVGSDTHAQLRYYLQDCRKMGQSLVVLGFNMSDVTRRGFVEKEPLTGQFSNLVKWRYQLRQSYLYTAVDVFSTEFTKRRLMPWWGTDVYAMHPYVVNSFGVNKDSEQAWQETLESLKTLKQVTAEDGTTLVVAVFPYQFQISADPRDNPYQIDKRKFTVDPFARLTQFCAQEKIPMVNLLELYTRIRQQMLQGSLPYDELFVDYCHPDAEGQNLAAGEIFRYIESHPSLINRPDKVTSKP